MLAVLLLTGFAQPLVQDSVTSKSFILVDDSGKPLATLGHNGTVTQFQIKSGDGLSNASIAVSSALPPTPLGAARFAIGSGSLISGACGGPGCGGLSFSAVSGDNELEIGGENTPHKTRHISVITGPSGSLIRVCGDTSATENCPVLRQN